MRFVIDSNVWISAIVFGGNPRRILTSIHAQGHVIILPTEIKQETIRILDAKFPEATIIYHKLLFALAKIITDVKLGKITAISRDPDDDMILATAVAGGADFIVSGDKDLLVLRHHSGVSIINPAEAITVLNK